MAALTGAYIDAYTQYKNQQNKSLANQEAALAKQLAESKAGTAQSYDSAAAQAYLNYAKQQNALPEQLQAQGINGGASETALTRIANNYALNQANNNASRASAISQLQNTYDTNVANLRQSIADDLAAQYYAAQQNQIQYNDTLNQRALEQYQATIERFTSEKSIDKAIKNLDKNDPNYTAKKQLLQLRKAQIKEAKKGSGGSGGGGRRSSGGRSYSSGGGSSGGGNNNSGGSNNSKVVNPIVTGANLVAKIAQDAYKKAAKKKGNGGR